MSCFHRSSFQGPSRSRIRKIESFSITIVPLFDKSLIRYMPPVQSRRFTRHLLLCALVIVFLQPSAFGQAIHTLSLRERFGQQCKSPGPDAIKTYNDAATLARASLDKLKALPIKSDADGINDALKKITVDEAMVAQFTRVAELLEAGVDKNARFGPLKQALDEMNAKSKILDQAYSPFMNCTSDNAPSDDTKKVLDDYKTLHADIQNQLVVGDQLKTAIKSIPAKVQEFLSLKLSSGSDGLAGRVDRVATLNEDPDPRTLRLVLAKGLPDLAASLAIRRLVGPVINRLSSALDPKFADLKDIITTKPTFDFSEVDKRLQEILRKAPHWADLLVEAARQQAKDADNAILQAMRDPFHQAGAALTQASLADAARKDFSTISDALQAVLVELQRTDLPSTLGSAADLAQQIKSLSDSLSALQQISAKLEQSVHQLNGNIPLDKSAWTMDSVDLFYFDDVARLIRVLSPGNARLIGGDKALQDNAIEKRRALDQASQTLLTDDAKVSDARQKVAKLDEQVRQAENKVQAAGQADREKLKRLNDAAEAADQRATEAENRRKRLQAKQTHAQDDLDDAKTAAQAAPDNAALQARVDNARRTLEAAKEQTAEAQADEDSAKERATAAHTDVTAAGTTDQELTDLKTNLTKAKSDLTQAESDRAAATDAQSKAIQDAFLAAQVENFAFAQARDNAPFWTNLPDNSTTSGNGAVTTPPPIASDSDPVSHVLLFGFPDSRTLFIRGQRDDIDLVRQIIKEFDRPEGQAVMTLRTMEISSDGTTDSAKRALKFLKEMDDELNDTQTKIDSALSRLRDAINQQVDVAANEYRQDIQNKAQQLELDINAAANDTFRKNDLIKKLNLLKHRLNLSHEELESIAFYDKDVMDALGWQDKMIDTLADTHFLNAVIPRPSHTVTLAQALIVLSLATPANRSAVIAKLKVVRNQPGLPEILVPDPAFASLRRFIGENGRSSDTLAFQSKLIESLRLNGITHVLETVAAVMRSDLELKHNTEVLEILQRDLPAVASREQQNALNDCNSQVFDGSSPTTFTLEQKKRALNDCVQQLTTQRNQIYFASLLPMLKWLQGNTPNANPEQLRKRIESALNDDNGMSTLLATALGLRRSARFRFSQASESAVNLTFRRYLEEINRDLNEVYVKPSFRRINEKLLKEHLGVGVIQETSILASNRLAARVDPKGSAQLAVGQERDALAAAQQLVNLFGVASKGLVNSATGSPQALAGGAATGGASSILTGAQSILNSLDQMPRDAPPEVFGIATGNLFQVTPVIDPSGQALRFRFDFVSATQIREPNDTIDPQLPRIERHSINTEVYLSDQQIRLISQFQANSRLGVAKRKSGGLPILKDLPGVGEVPLIGWFIKRGGRAAQTQQSFIFCQTAMYPTLSEVLDEAVQSPTFTGF